ncbi:hypothetical protein EDC04DRAFT_2731303 [Pisolithus marmoratus]|nr:hypothetical protein EDC04DRAFT_2731303 [Pisolithus marmoratus]
MLSSLNMCSLLTRGDRPWISHFSLRGTPHALVDKDVPANLQHAMLRLNFPPSYVIVGVYSLFRLFTDKALYKPAWDKCKHGV